MLKIALCDDEKLVLVELEKILRDVLEKNNITVYEIYTFMSGEELLEKAEILDLIFLDIEMPNMDGIETGRLLKKKKPDCTIVMATGKVERFKEAFKIEAFRFVTKTFKNVEIEEAVENYCSQRIGRQEIRLNKDRNEYCFRQKDVVYVRAYNGGTEFLVGNEYFRKEESLSSIIKVLDSDCFFCINKTYCVNLFWIENYSDEKIQISGKILEVSRRKKKEFEKKYIEFGVN